MSTAPRGGYGDQRVLTAIAVGAVLLFLPVVALASQLVLVLVPAIVAAALLAAVNRDSLHGMAALAILVVVWIAGRPPTLTPWTPVAALLLFTAHTALALRTTEPPGSTLGAVTVRRWVARGGVVALATVVVYAVSFGLHLSHPHTNDVVVVLALVILGALILLLRRESIATDES